MQLTELDNRKWEGNTGGRRTRRESLRHVWDLQLFHVKFLPASPQSYIVIKWICVIHECVTLIDESDIAWNL